MAKAPKNYYLITTLGGSTCPIPATPAQWIAGLWKSEKEKVAENPDYKPKMPALVYSERITEQEFALLMANFPLGKPKIGDQPIQPNINLDGSGGRN